VRYPSDFDAVKIIGLWGWRLENWVEFKRGTTSCIFDGDIVLYGSQDRWADSYNSLLSGLIHIEDLAVDPVGQSTEFML